MRVLAALLLTACGRLSFDALPSTDGDGSLVGGPDAGVVAAACMPKPMQVGGIHVTSSQELVNAVAALTPNDIIYLDDGTYTISSRLDILASGVTLRSSSNDASKVIIQGDGVLARLFEVHGSNVSFIALTIKTSMDDGIFVEPTSSTDTSGFLVYDVSFIDIGGTAVRVRSFNNQATGPFVENGEVACSRVTHTTPSACVADSVFGVRLVATRGWAVHHNYFAASCSPLRSRAVWADQGARDISVTANLFVGNMNNIMFGSTTGRIYLDALPAGCTGTPQVWGGEICNNQIAGLTVGARSGPDFDEGIALWNACDTNVMHNTIVSPPAAETFENIEYRFTDSYVHLINNLTSIPPLLRDGGRLAPGSNNVEYTSTAQFVDAQKSDLRPIGPIAGGTPITRCLNDASGKPRAATPTPGAFEP